MSRVSRISVLVVGLAVLGCLTGCQGEAGQGEFQFLPMFGNGTKDPSFVVAEVNGINITVRDLELYLENLPKGERSKFAGEDGRKLALNRMVSQALLAFGAVEKELYNDPAVAYELIAQRRLTLERAMRNLGILRGSEPSEEEVREYFMNNRDRYRQLGTVSGRHIELNTEEEAQTVYRLLQKGGPENSFPQLVQKYSVNKITAAREGELGWFNKGGFVAGIRNPEVFSAVAYELEKGVNPPVKAGDRWHVVEISHREYERPATFQEARDRVLSEMLPGYQEALIKDYLLAARKKGNVVLHGEFAPGEGMVPQEILARAMALDDPTAQIELCDLVYTDFPESDRADDALFLAAQVFIDGWVNLTLAERYLTLLIENYPESELYDDAVFLRDNLYNPDALKPGSIEDLKR